MANVHSNRLMPTPSAYAREHLYYVQEIGTLTSRSPHISTRENIHSFLFLVVVSGSGSFSYRGQKSMIHTGDCIFIDCHESYSHESSKDDPWTLNWVHFYGQSLSQLYQYYVEMGFSYLFHPADNTAILSTLSSLFHAHEQKNALTEITANKYLTDIITYSFTENKENRETISLQNKLQMIRDYLIANSSKKLTLDSLSAMFYVSKYHLSREYKRYFGITLMNDLNNMRVSAAKSLLRFSDDSIDSIAEQCGFNDSAYFIKVFKNVENMTPSSYRKKW